MILQAYDKGVGKGRDFIAEERDFQTMVRNDKQASLDSRAYWRKRWVDEAIIQSQALREAFSGEWYYGVIPFNFTFPITKKKFKAGYLLSITLNREYSLLVSKDNPRVWVMIRTNEGGLGPGVGFSAGTAIKIGKSYGTKPQLGADSWDVTVSLSGDLPVLGGVEGQVSLLGQGFNGGKTFTAGGGAFGTFNVSKSTIIGISVDLGKTWIWE